MSYAFREVSSKDLATFFASHPQGSFAQSIPMAEVRADNGRDIRYVAVYQGKTVVAGAQVSIIAGRITSADITSGPLLDYTNDALLAFFTDELQRFLRAHGCAYVTISPYIEYSEAARKALTKLGWQYSGRINASAVGIRGNIRWIFVKDLQGLTPENYRDSYAKRHRRYIKNHDKGLTIRRLKRDDLPLFLDIMKHTAERRHFTSRSDDYFYSLYDHFGDNAQFLIVELDKTTPVAGILFIESNNEVVSFLGGAVVDYARYRGSYLLHDHMIKYSIEKGYKRYNFYGIEGKLDDPNAEGYGIYEFKAKFGTGQAVELLGEFVLPIHKVKFVLLQATQKVKRKKL